MTAPASSGGVTDAPALPGIVVQPDWLEAHLGASNLRVIDMREPDAYDRAHIPGAAHLELARLGTTQEGLENVLLPPHDFAALMAEVGISAESSVVVYDDQWGLAAARLLWALHYYGHDGVAVLNGGWDRWAEEGRPLADTSHPRSGGRFEPRPRPEAVATGDWLAQQLADPQVVLVDTRTEAEFAQGHLPEARWWDWFEAVPPGSWELARDIDELRAEWSRLGVTAEAEVVVYCRSGMRAAHTYMVMKLAGISRVRLYDGSWQEWSMRSSGSDGT